MPSLSVLLALMALETGGAETHVVGLARELNKRGHRVVVTSHGGCLEEELSAAGICHIQAPLHSRAPWDVLQALQRMNGVIKRKQIDLIHAHARIPAWIGHFVSNWNNRPLITTAHGIYSTNLGLRTLTAWGDEAIAVSSDVKAHMVKNFGVAGRCVTVIPNGVDTSRFAATVNAGPVLDEFSLPAADPKMVYISRLSGDRGEVALRVIEAVPELLQRWPTLTTFIVGEGDKLPEVKQWASKVNDDFRRPAILVTGSRTDTAAIISAAQVVIGVGRVILEGMASAKPVVIAGEAGFMGLLTPKLLPVAKRHNFSGRGSNQRTKACVIANAVDKALRDDKLALELGAFGRKTVLEEFSLAQMAQEVEQVYYKALRRDQ
jgi:glycosyltransferase involved in cell wall biosynthesis